MSRGSVVSSQAFIVQLQASAFYEDRLFDNFQRYRIKKRWRLPSFIMLSTDNITNQYTFLERKPKQFAT